MAQRSLGGQEDDQCDELSVLEDLIQREGTDLRDARKALRDFLLSQAGIEVSGQSVGDALALIARQPSQNELAAIVLLRCLAIKGLVPESNYTNHIICYTVEICEGAIPQIISFLKMDKSAQNYEKFLILSGGHERITNILSPLRLPYGDLEALLKARREILGCLSHSILRIYARHFKLAELRVTIESLFTKLQTVLCLDTTLLSDIEECNRIVSSARSELAVTHSFLNQEFLSPFLGTCETALSQFLVSRRTRFAANIAWGGGPRHELEKRYPLHEPGREVRIVIPLRNTGPGMATNVRIKVEAKSADVAFGGETIMLGNVLPGDFSVTLDVMIISQCSDFGEILDVEWGEIGGHTRKSESFEFYVVAQSSVIDWQSLEYFAPYSTDVAEGDQFVGRQDKVRHLAAKVLRSSMESFYITGQKRVGKTSLALAAVNYAKESSAPGALDFHYVLWGNVAHADPGTSLRLLGESIEEFMVDCLQPGLNVAKGDYHGSLAALIKLLNAALRIAPERRFVIILDEFDEIHQELFLQGNLAETFFGNLRALSRCRNICVILVGGENMPFIMDRQGQKKWNNFSRVNLSYFSRDSEWSDFQLLVKVPAAGILNWHDDAVSEVFNITNGNPYFSKIVCASTFRSAVLERDADITASEVRRATEAEVSVLGANSFAHLWQDGVPKAADEREPEILRRMRVLVALARCLRQGLSPTAANITDHRTSTSLSGAETAAVLNDFVRREVFIEEEKQYGFGLPIFRMWLVDVGVSQLIADALNEELANAVLAQENAALVRSQEVVDLSAQWPTYRGKHIGTDEIRAWYQQVDSHRDQRILFKLLKRTRVFSETLVRERLKAAHALIRRSLPEFVMRSRGSRRRDVLLTYVDGEGKSGASYASLYAEENGIAAECVIAPGEFRSRFNNHVERNGVVAALVIMDDIAATGKSLSENIDRFLLEHDDLMQSTVVRVVTLVATEHAQSSISKKLEEFNGIDINLGVVKYYQMSILPFHVTLVYGAPKKKSLALNRYVSISEVKFIRKIH